MADLSIAVGPPRPRPYRLLHYGQSRLTQFSHNLFSGPENQTPTTIYSNDYAMSERVARVFLEEKVVGFDMEWIYPERQPAPRPLQEVVSLIQVASEDKIALFHIGRHKGRTPKDILAPSLRALIENPSIRKTGQSIMGDFLRLKTYFNLEPKGAFELSYFHKLLQQEYETSYIKGGLRSLVEFHFPGLSLMKDTGMHQNWLEPLSPKCEAYAIADVYASLMLFHQMNAKRLKMNPCPPLPKRTEAYMAYTRGWPERKIIVLEPLRPGARNLNARMFFWLQEGLEEDEELACNLDAESKMLYRELAACREDLAGKIGLPPRYLATDSALRNVALKRPRLWQECARLRGLGFQKHLHELAKNWVGVVIAFEQAPKNIRVGRDSINSTDKTEPHRDVKPAEDNELSPVEPTDDGASASGSDITASTEGSGSAVATQLGDDKVPQLHTGLSFAMAEADITDESTEEDLTDEGTEADVTDEGTEPEDGSSNYGTPIDVADLQHESASQVLHTDTSSSVTEKAVGGTTTGEENAPQKKAVPSDAAGVHSLSDGPVLHTGLSFSMANADIDEGDLGGDEFVQRYGRDPPPRKRKRSPSPDNRRKSPVKSS